MRKVAKPPLKILYFNSVRVDFAHRLEKGNQVKSIFASCRGTSSFGGVSGRLASVWCEGREGSPRAITFRQELFQSWEQGVGFFDCEQFHASLFNRVRRLQVLLRTHLIRQMRYKRQTDYPAIKAKTGTRNQICHARSERSLLMFRKRLLVSACVVVL